MTERSIPTERVGSRETRASAGTKVAAWRARYPGVALAVIVTCQLMLILDGTIVNIALPKIQEDLHFSATGLSWVISAYSLAFGGLLLLGGRATSWVGGEFSSPGSRFSPSPRCSVVSLTRPDGSSRPARCRGPARRSPPRARSP